MATNPKNLVEDIQTDTLSGLISCPYCRVHTTPHLEAVRIFAIDICVLYCTNCTWPMSVVRASDFLS